ncbi:transcription-repair coupling factor [Oenococcus oeni IOEB_C23]|uniref:transcription-repair coupling factor n=1 Tax=Oenococcus oeni TaxID=1247 RepID=UPI00050EF752|nr:transcription-repair coupling factor [Oenococcus oeni]KGH66602.1 transcription-repair coupling factor [Oenococcus oeni IOEB_C23]
MMHSLTDFISRLPLIEKIVSNQADQTSTQLISGVNDTPKAALAAGVFVRLKAEKSSKKILLLTDTQFRADQLTSDLEALLEDENVFEMQSEESLATETAVASRDADLSRVLALRALLSKENSIVVVPLSGLSRRYPDPEFFQQAVLDFKIANSYPQEQLAKKLIEMGYNKQTLVANPGEFSVRGEIVDIYPINFDEPIRLDFFDDELESMRTFDADSQKSLNKIKQASVSPVSDFLLPRAEFSDGLKQLEQAFVDYRNKLKGAEKKKLTEFFNPLLEAAKHFSYGHELLPFSEFFLKHSIFEYLQSEDLILIDDFARINDQTNIQEKKNAEWITDRLREFKLLPDLKVKIDGINLIKKSQQKLSKKIQKFVNPKIYLSNLTRGLAGITFTSRTQLITRQMQQYFGQMPALKLDLESYRKRDFTVLLQASNRERLLSLQRTLHDFGMNFAITDDILTGTAQLQIGSLSHGFELPEEKIVVMTETELFAKVKKRVPRHQTFSNAEKITSYTELKTGDYVVHVNHGIGRYEGLTTLEANGGKQDYITIAYAQKAKIFVPVTHLNLVQKYIGAADGRPKVNSLNSTDWAKTKRRVTAKVEDIADELIALYSKREGEVGYAFSVDDQRQQEFDDGFAYPETVDQLRSIKEIKSDMENKKPMDRLLVGDVGFGKTEVAFRAAFKAIEDHKQVAFLTPTTILSQQHYQTAIERFSDFPEIKIAMLSRFNTAGQNKEVIKKLKAHQLDMVIGTHRLLSKDVAFDDLGLLIIDEEQRFGVKHKEKIKQLRANVDVLTLTATPIPRTLNMALVGARDLSVLETPPANRFPIQTYVLEENWPVIAYAIEKEFSRGGQTFFLHNRVQDIERTVGEIQRIVPDANVGYIHGQMNETQLEDVLMDFLNGIYDVLVTTTIIETGVDIPNANTLIVENSERFGLSQLYQLRGRIGRSNRLAYAYFTYPGDRQPTEDAQKRLEAIRDFTELGSGFKLAMRDLSIRGAGDLLGKQQHGFIDSVGYELYQQMLQEAVSQKQGKDKKVMQTNAEIVLNIEALLPDSYVNDSSQKVELYQRIRKSRTDEQFNEVRQDLIDRFGPIPEVVDNLFALAHLKNATDAANVINLHGDDSQIRIIFSRRASQILAGETIFKTLKGLPYKVRVKAVDDQKLQLTVILNEDEKLVYIDKITKYLELVYKELKNALG